MAMAVRAFYLAVVVLALVPLLAEATAAENLLVRSCSLTTTTLPPRCSEFPLGVDAPPTAAGTPASVDHLLAHSPSAALPDATAPHSLGVSAGACQDQDATAAAQAAPVVVSGHNLDESVSIDRCDSSPPSTTHSDDSSPRSLGASDAARQGHDNTASPEAAAAPPAPRYPCGSCDLSTRAAAVDATDAVSQRGGTVSAIAPATKVLLRAVSLLASPFLPRPMAVLAALSFLPTTARARSDDCYKLNHATCVSYPYDNETDSVDRARPNKDMGLAAVCLHPFCHADSPERLASVLLAQLRGRRGDILHIYCTVRTLESLGGIEEDPILNKSSFQDSAPLFPPEAASSLPKPKGPSIFPWMNTWRVHLPIADPAAAAASGGDICYVELAHLDYREGYYIHCPAVGEHHETYCTEFPEEAIAAAVWEHRRLNYRYTVGSRYATYQSKYRDEL